MITLPPSVRFAHPETGPVLEIDHRIGSARIHLHGAHVTSWRPQGQPEQLWMSSESEFGPGVAIRGGVPICFPWFAMGPGDWQPQHGFVRRLRWRLLGARQNRDEVTVTLALDDRDVHPDTPGRDRWPHRFALEYDVVLTATAGLLLRLTVTNTGEESLPVGGALHTYLAVGDITETAVDSLSALPYRDKVTGTSVPATARDSPPEQSRLRLSGETDRVYDHHDPRPHGIGIASPMGRLVMINHSSHTVVWNPWQEKAATMADFPDDGWREMLCVEAAQPTTPDGNWPVVLAPGQSHLLGQDLFADPDSGHTQVVPGC